MHQGLTMLADQNAQILTHEIENMAFFLILPFHLHIQMHGSKDLREEILRLFQRGKLAR